ncbi:uncharacterized protein LOC132062673 [Lycium ferocissimum]|uniref:uncharacterized protein LOC132062673 n=1 Tax=Lycium ferocissimum TaxID=112874 RepID=UPI0028156290|nr:uncharacterized protein LOC132062673 [Lycium ferocissimum]
MLISYRIQDGLCNNFHRILSARAHHARLAWRRFLLSSSLYKRRTFLPLSRIAQAVNLALCRSFADVPGIFALTCQKNPALAKALPGMDLSFLRNNASFLRAQYGFTGLILTVFECAKLLVRAFHLVILFSPCIAMARFADVLGPQFRKIWIRVVLWTLESAGPVFIKWGQWAASRPDSFARDLRAELSKLQSRAPQHNSAHSIKAIEEAFGSMLTEMFDGFNESPVGSGSIAQVHTAFLKHRHPDGRKIKPIKVALKVRHPEVVESIERDYKIINIIAKISRFVPSLEWLRLDESFEQFSVFMMSQVDLRREADNLSRFNYIFRRWKHASFPKHVNVHPDVLVETFEEGKGLADYVDGLEGHDERLKSALAHTLGKAHLKMLVVDNFFHADLHPGNILVRVVQQKSSLKHIFKSKKPRVVFLDVGMAAELSQYENRNLVEFLNAVARRDGSTAAKCTLNFSKKQNCPNPDAFIKEVKESFDFWGTPEGDSVPPADCVMQLLEQVRRHKVNIDSSVCTAILTTLSLEGLLREVDPKYDMMHTLKTLLMKQDLSDTIVKLL